MGDSELSTLVRLQEDERQVRNLIARLAHLADYGDLDEYMTLFTEDAVWQWRDVRNEGAAAILADRVMRRESGGQGPGTGTRHVNTTLYVEVDGSDTATAHSYWIFVHDGEPRPTIHSLGRYRDTLVRTATGWKVSHRHSIVTD